MAKVCGVLDLHFVTPALAVGGRFLPEAAGHLALDHGIARVVDLRAEASDDESALRRHGIRLLHLPTEDTCAAPLARIRAGVAFVCDGLDRDERVLIHCQYGIGRSASLAVCVLVARGEAPLAAMERVKRARRVISPSPAQLEAVAVFCAAMRSERGARWEAPSAQDFAAIAWRHLRDGASLEEAREASTRERAARDDPFRDGPAPRPGASRC